MALTKKYNEVYGPGINDQQVSLELTGIESRRRSKADPATLKTILSLIDLTSLNTEDNAATAHSLCEKVSSFTQHYPDYPNVAAICVYPTLAETVRMNLHAEGVKLAVVGAGFPSSQTFLSVKLAECELLTRLGADEIDVVISVGQFLAGNYQAVSTEIELIKSAIGAVHLKVILETGILKSAENIRLASLLAMEAGADFIKTSTGKTSPAASPEAVLVMAQAIRDFHSITGRKVGIKPAGGIVSVEDAIPYLSIIEQTLGKEWMCPELFRFGASRLANHVLSEALSDSITYF